MTDDGKQPTAPDAPDAPDADDGEPKLADAVPEAVPPAPIDATPASVSDPQAALPEA
ncbi:MAG: resuscitation-promoting factor RpfE, partial [Deltaproteobacteria bacterium]|nr:resuscitation-promoting factor RpfE [Deltaproteobacteria bacterium]